MNAPLHAHPVEVITITVNGEPHTLPANTHLAHLVERLAEPPQALATAVNGDFVARTQRSHCVLHEGDAVFTFQPITGG